MVLAALILLLCVYATVYLSHSQKAYFIPPHPKFTLILLLQMSLIEVSKSFTCTPAVSCAYELLRGKAT